MGLFSRKKEWDATRIDLNKAAMRSVFNKAVPDGDSYRLVYGFSDSVKSMNYAVLRTTTTTITSLVIGWRESDMSIVILPTTPELNDCGEPERFVKGAIKKAKMSGGQYCVYRPGGVMAGYVQFGVASEYDEKYYAYMNQPEEWEAFNQFWKAFAA